MCIFPITFQGVEIDPMKRADWTPLMLACTKQDDAIVKFLAEHGASPRLRNKDGWNSFHLACREGNTSIVSYLLNQDPTLLESRSKNGRTPLHTAGINAHEHQPPLFINHAFFQFTSTSWTLGNCKITD